MKYEVNYNIKFFINNIAIVVIVFHTYILRNKCLFLACSFVRDSVIKIKVIHRDGKISELLKEPYLNRIA